MPKAPVTIGIIFTFIFHSFFSSQARAKYLSFFSQSFSFILWSAGTAKSTILQILFFFFIRSGLLVEIRWSMCMSKSHRSLCVSFSRTSTGLCIYHLFVWSNLNFLTISQWITLPTQSCLVLYSFCAYIFAAFTYYVIDGFISVTALSTFAILLRLIYSRFDIICSYGVVLCCY